MISPADIQSKEFSRGVRGYKDEEVDLFLDELTLDYEAVLKENAALRDEISDLKNRLDEYKNQEHSVINTLESARSLMKDISASAEKRADIIVRNAEIDASAIVRKAKNELADLENEKAALDQAVSSFKKNYKALLESALIHFDSLQVPEEKPNVVNQAAVDQFNELVNAVDGNGKREFAWPYGFDDGKTKAPAKDTPDLFEDEFKKLDDDLSRTIVTFREEVKE